MLYHAAPETIPAIQDVYRQAGDFAHARGSINVWNMNTPYCEKLIREGELFWSGDEDSMNGAVRLTTQTNPDEWPDGNENHLFIAKLATGDAVRGRSYVPTVMLPEIEAEAEARGMEGLRLNCFPHPKLMKFYEEGCGFILKDIVTFDSQTIGRQITTAKYEKPLA